MIDFRLVKELKEIFKDNDVNGALDFDEHIWDLHKATNYFIKREYGVTVTRAEVNNWNYLVDNFPRILEAWGDWEIYKQGCPIPGSQVFVEAMLEILGEDRLKIVTASFDTIHDEKDNLIKSKYSISNVIHTKNKSLVTKNCFLADDALHNISCHANTNQQLGIIFDLGYGWNQEPLENNNKHITRAKSYNDVLVELIKYYR